MEKDFVNPFLEDDDDDLISPGFSRPQNNSETSVTSNDSSHDTEVEFGLPGLEELGASTHEQPTEENDFNLDSLPDITKTLGPSSDDDVNNADNINNTYVDENLEKNPLESEEFDFDFENFNSQNSTIENRENNSIASGWESMDLTDEITLADNKNHNSNDNDAFESLDDEDLDSLLENLELSISESELNDEDDYDDWAPDENEIVDESEFGGAFGAPMIPPVSAPTSIDVGSSSAPKMNSIDFDSSENFVLSDDEQEKLENMLFDEKEKQEEKSSFLNNLQKDFETKKDKKKRKQKEPENNSETEKETLKGKFAAKFEEIKAQIRSEINNKDDSSNGQISENQTEKKKGKKETIEEESPNSENDETNLDENNADKTPKKQKSSSNPLLKILKLISKPYTVIADFLLKLLLMILSFLGMLPIIGKLLQPFLKESKVWRVFSYLLPVLLVFGFMWWNGSGSSLVKQSSTTFPDGGSAKFYNFHYDSKTKEVVGTVENNGEVIAEVVPTFTVESMNYSINPTSWFYPKKEKPCVGKPINVQIGEKVSAKAECNWSGEPKHISGKLKWNG